MGELTYWLQKFLDRAAVLEARRRWPRPRRFDRNLVVIGGGAAGLVAAYVAAMVKAKVTLVEKSQMGGDCLNTGCVPSKALIRTAKLLAQIRRAPELGIGKASAELAFTEVMERVRRTIQAIAPHDSVERYQGLGVEVIRGEARIVSPWSVEIVTADGKRTLATRSIIVAAGARPSVPPIPGLDEAGYLTSDNVWELRDLPGRLVVLGGGPIGCELAQCFARLGSRVTLLELAPRLLNREDPEVSELIAQTFAGESIELRVNCEVLRIVEENGENRLIARHGGEEETIAFDQILVAVGRTPNTRDCGLEEVGISIADSGAIATNRFLQTAHPNIYACGDVAGPFQFTHMASHQAWCASVNALFGSFWRFPADYSLVPRATFTDPEVARVGLNELEARDRGIRYEVSTYDLGELDRAVVDGVARGWVKVLTATGTDRILGVTIVGEHAGDLIGEFVLAMKNGLGLNKVLGTIHVYPTLAEANRQVAAVWKRAHAPRSIFRWLELYQEWRRG